MKNILYIYEETTIEEGAIFYNDYFIGTDFIEIRFTYTITFNFSASLIYNVFKYTMRIANFFSQIYNKLSIIYYFLRFHNF